MFSVKKNFLNIDFFICGSVWLEVEKILMEGIVEVGGEDFVRFFLILWFCIIFMGRIYFFSLFFFDDMDLIFLGYFFFVVKKKKCVF